jgi:hypothetical protein
MLPCVSYERLFHMLPASGCGAMLEALITHAKLTAGIVLCTLSGAGNGRAGVLMRLGKDSDHSLLMIVCNCSAIQRTSQ